MRKLAYDGTVKIGTKLDESGLKSGLSGLGNFAKKGLSVVTSAITATGAALGAATAAAISVGSSFEEGMSKVSAISGATGEELGALAEKAEEMGSKTVFSATESAEAMTYMAMAGWKTQDMLDGIEGIMNLAAASGEDLATTSDIVTDALTAFGLSAGESGHFADILAAASSNANTNVSMMGETFKYVAPVAGALGFSAEDCATAIGLMANSGIKASQAGTSLRSIMTRMAKPTDESAKAMEQLGLSITNSDGSMRSLDEIMGDLRIGFAGLTEAEQASVAAALAGQEGMSGLLAIVNASDEDFEKLKSSIYNCNGAAETMAETMQDNLTGKITILKSALEGLGIEIYESLQNPLKEAVAAGTEAITELTEAFKTGGTAGMVEAGAQIITDLLLGVAQRLPDVIQMAVDVIQSIVENLNGNIAPVISAGSQILQALVNGIIQVSGTLGTLAFNIVSVLAQGIIEKAPVMFQSGIQMISELGNGLSQAIPGFLAKALPIAADFSESLKTAAGQLIDAGIELILNITDGLIAALPDLIAYVPTIITNIANILNENIPKLISCGAGIIMKLIVGIVENIPNLIANFPKIVQSILSVLSAVNWAGAGGKIISGITSGIKSLASLAVNAVKNVAQNGFNAFRNVDWLSLGTGLIKKIVNGIVSLFTSIPSKLKSIGQAAMSGFKGMNWFSVGSNIISGITSGIASAAGNLVNAAVNAASNAINTVKGWLGIHSPSKRARDEIGVNMIAGIEEGVEEESPKLAEESENSVKTAVGSMKKATAMEFVGKMQAQSYDIADNNEMAARNKYQNNGYEPDDPDDDQDIIIHNEFNVDGKKMEDNIVKKTKNEIQREQKANRAVKGDVVFAG